MADLILLYHYRLLSRADRWNGCRVERKREKNNARTLRKAGLVTMSRGPTSREFRIELTPQGQAVLAKCRNRLDW